MTITKLIEELVKLENEGKGHYKVKSSCWDEEFDITIPNVDDNKKEVFL